MKITDLSEKIKGTILTGKSGADREIASTYCCDLLSWVMSHAKKGSCWITVQTHLNVIAVASLLELPCIIVPENIDVEESTVNKAIEEEIAIIKSPLDAYSICSIISKVQGD